MAESLKNSEKLNNFQQIFVGEQRSLASIKIPQYSTNNFWIVAQNFIRSKIEKKEILKIYQAHDSIKHLEMELGGPKCNEAHDDEEIDI